MAQILCPDEHQHAQPTKRAALKLVPPVQDRRVQGNVGCNIYVRNLPETLSDEELGGLFAVRVAFTFAVCLHRCRRVRIIQRISMHAELRPRGLVQAAA